MPAYNSSPNRRPPARRAPARSLKPAPRPRPAVGSQLPSARRRQQHRRGNTYLKRTQGFGGQRRGARRVASRRDPRRIYALIIVGCALLLFAASILWYANRSVEITLNGETVSVRIHSSIERIIEEQEISTTPGDLLAVDDSVLERRGGPAYTVELDGKRIDNDSLDTTELGGGEELSIADGEDVYEPHEVQATEIMPTLTVKGTGAVRYVETWGEPGRSEVWVGEQTGLTVDKGVVKEAVNCVVACTSVSPSVKGSKFVALTFDEGPSERTEDILAILKEKGVEATFFVSGDKVAANAAVVKAIADSGNELGTNAYSDTSLGELTGEDLRSQITRGFDVVEEATGTRPALLRPPFGTFTEQNWAEAMDLVSAVVTWNVDSGDWLLQGAQTVVDTVVNAVGNGSIVLLTDNSATADQTVEALPQLIDQLQADGYTLVTLSDLIATDDDLSDALTLSKVSMPESAVLPTLANDAGGDAASE